MFWSVAEDLGRHFSYFLWVDPDQELQLQHAFMHIVFHRHSSRQGQRDTEKQILMPKSLDYIDFLHFSVIYLKAKYHADIIYQTVNAIKCFFIVSWNAQGSKS